jgi:uncharacterized protein (TIGR03067 family)
MTTKLLAVAAGLLIAAHAVADDQVKKADADELVGTYTITGGERDGQELTKEKFKEVTVKISKNAITTYDANKKEVYAATFTLDKGQTPWKITMTATITPVGDQGVGAKAEGLIQRDGDTVKLVYALPDGKAPTALKAGEKQQMFVLTKSAK